MPYSLSRRTSTTFEFLDGLPPGCKVYANESHTYLYCTLKTDEGQAEEASTGNCHFEKALGLGLKY
jgi:hypothetical protein